MDLILWRHAEAHDGVPDASRALTEKGHTQARLMAEWLQAHLPTQPRVLLSPARRAQETAQALSFESETSNAVGLAAMPFTLLSAAGWPDAQGAVIVVGHQPTLGQVAAYLICGEAADWSVKKGAIWWLSNRVRQNESQTVLRCVLGPDHL